MTASSVRINLQQQVGVYLGNKLIYDEINVANDTLKLTSANVVLQIGQTSRRESDEFLFGNQRVYQPNPDEGLPIRDVSALLERFRSFKRRDPLRHFCGFGVLRRRSRT